MKITPGKILLAAAVCCMVLVSLIQIDPVSAQSDSANVPSPENNRMWLLSHKENEFTAKCYANFNFNDSYADLDGATAYIATAGGLNPASWDFPLEPGLDSVNPLILDTSKEICVYLKYANFLIEHGITTVTLTIGDLEIGSEKALGSSLYEEVINIFYFKCPKEIVSAEMGTINVHVELSGDVGACNVMLSKESYVEWPIVENLLAMSYSGNSLEVSPGENKTFQISLKNPSASAITAALSSTANITKAPQVQINASANSTAASSNATNPSIQNAAFEIWETAIENNGTFTIEPGGSVNITCTMKIPGSAASGDFGKITISGAKCPICIPIEVRQVEAMQSTKNTPGFEMISICIMLVIALVLRGRRNE